MDKKNKTKKMLTEVKPVNDKKKPDENMGYYFSSHIKIYDPENNKIFVQKRADT